MEKQLYYIPVDRLIAESRGESLPEDCRGTVLFADIKGFSRFTDILKEELGYKHAAEELNKHLNAAFTAIISVVHSYRGSVISFNGDSINCWFEKDKGDAAVSCALDMLEAMIPFKKLKTPNGTDIPLILKVSISSGKGKRFIVGDRSIQKFDVLSSEALERTFVMEKLLEGNEIAVSEEIVTTLEDALVVKEARETENKDTFYIIEDFRMKSSNDMDVLQSKTPRPGEDRHIIEDIKSRIEKDPWPNVEDIVFDRGEEWILPPMRKQLETEPDELFSAELRKAVVFFLKFNGIEYEEKDAALKLNKLIETVQNCLLKYEGYMLQVVLGDKGSYIYGTFGAPIAHEDDPKRAVTALIALKEQVKAIDYIWEVKISVSQGSVYAGGYGADKRRTYGLLGPEVNVAARLMEIAKSGQILFSERIYRKVNNIYSFTELGSIRVKGISEGVSIYALNKDAQKKDLLSGFFDHPTEIYGRDKEKEIIKNLLQSVEQDENKNLVIKGEAGIGKSMLIDYLKKEAEKLGFTVLLGWGDAIEVFNSFHAWRPIFQQLFGINEINQTESLRRYIMEDIRGNTYLEDHLPLLEEILPLGFQDNELTAQLHGEVRADNVHEFCSHLIKYKVKKNSRYIIILDDAHWIDSASFAVLEIVRDMLTPHLVVIGSRPFISDPLEIFTEIENSANTSLINLQNLKPASVEGIVKDLLEVDTLPREVIDFILIKAEGHPFFSEQMALALRDGNYIKIEDRTCTISPDTGDLLKIHFPDTIQGIITSRIDNLPATQKSLLKVASVIGRVFSLRSLHAIYPEKHDSQTISDNIEVLKELEFVLQAHGEPDVNYIFKHVVTQEVAYNLLLFSQRVELHRKIASWYEQNFSQDLSAFYPVLAHHYKLGDDISKAMECLEKAGMNASNNYANIEAINFFTELLDMLYKQDQYVLPDERLALIELKMGEACAYNFRHKDAQEYIEKGLKRLGINIPDNGFTLIGGMISEIFQQFRHRKKSEKYIGKWENRKEILIHAANAINALVEVYMALNKMGNMLYVMFLNLNLSELINDPGSMGQCYVNLGIGLDMANMEELALSYLQLADITVKGEMDLPYRIYILLYSGFYFIGKGMWRKALTLVEEALGHCKHLGDRRKLRDSTLYIAGIHLFRGQWESAMENAERVYHLSIKHNDVHMEANALQVICTILMDQNRVEEAAKYLHDLERLSGDDMNVMLASLTKSVAARIYLAQGDYEKALETNDKVVEGFKKIKTFVFAFVIGFQNITDIYLHLLEQGIDPVNIKTKAKEAVKLFKKFSTSFLLGIPGALLQMGRLEWLTGNKNKAYKTWKRGLENCERIEKPLELGKIYYQLGDCLPDDHPEKMDYIQKAAETFESLGLSHKKEEALKLLKQG